MCRDGSHQPARTAATSAELRQEASAGPHRRRGSLQRPDHPCRSSRANSPRRSASSSPLRHGGLTQAAAALLEIDRVELLECLEIRPCCFQPPRTSGPTLAGPAARCETPGWGLQSALARPPCGPASMSASPAAGKIATSSPLLSRAPNTCAEPTESLAPVQEPPRLRAGSRRVGAVRRRRQPFRDDAAADDARRPSGPDDPPNALRPGADRGRRGRTPTPESLLATITRQREWGDFGIAEEEALERFRAIEPLNAGDALRAFYSAYAERVGKPRWGEDPDLREEHAEDRAGASRARFVHVIRDSRDVALSIRDRAIKEHPIDRIMSAGCDGSARPRAERSGSSATRRSATGPDPRHPGHARTRL